MHRLREATVTDIDFLVDVVLEATRAQGRLPPDFDEHTFRAAYTEWTAHQIADSGSASTTYVIEVDGRRAGRLRVVRTPAEIELAGIQLLPDHQSHGIGTQIIKGLLAEAAAAGSAMTLLVEKDNPRAYELYLRLGFTVTAQTDKEYTMTAVPQWMRPPRPEGWYADDLDQIPEAPRHIELIDGALVFRVFPQRVWHSRLVTALVRSLTDQAPAGVEVEREMTIRLDERNRPEPDVLVTTTPYAANRTYYTPDTILLVVEVVSPESAHRDRTVKPRKYAEAGIAHYWRVEDEDESPVVHAYELDGPTRSYAPTGVYRHELRSPTPFAIELDLDGLVPGHRS